MRRKFIMLMLALSLLAASLPAQADLLFTRQDNGYSNTALGIIQGAGDPVSPLVSNMGGNSGQGIYPFKNADGNFRIAITLYTGNGTDVISIYNPGEQSQWTQQSSWKAPLREATTTLHNTRMMVEMGGSLYATAYDIPIVSRVSTANDVYKQDKKYEYYHNDSKYNGHGEALNAYNGNLYAIFTGSNDPWNTTSGSYRLNQLVKLDSELNELARVEMKGKNLDGFTPGAYSQKEGRLYVATLGGVQKFGDEWNPESCIEMADLNTMEVTSLITAGEMNVVDPTFKHMFDAVVFVGDKVYIQAAKWTSGEDYTAGYSIRIYETTLEKLSKGDIGKLLRDFTGDYGYRLGLAYDESTNYLWAGVGYSLWRYDGANWTEFGSNALSGNISAYTAVSPTGTITPVEPDTPLGDGGGGGGCNGDWGAIALLALMPLFLRRRV
ncbi:Synerg-CTERM sorting domain-containing protein [Cloacibacillus porcorum]|uniref:Uncharacterized protein n=1 Tax=Cloacibacillus porcorum TaxID=1197717 RepID=A0A1B2I497_9BACT|nr:Synerg-CTERM sorting domain-containing protein [Cloacibacillus porcorum]ANZ44795.1 hypothetical protein BED41_06650 [Cloacibacillus porcorum]